MSVCDRLLDCWQAELTLVNDDHGEPKLEKNVKVLVDTQTGEIVLVSRAQKAGVELNLDGEIRESLLPGKDGKFKIQYRRFPQKILIPGFVNAHSHAFQRGLRGKGEEGDGNFWTWRQGMMNLVTSLRGHAFRSHCARCFREMRDRGITCVGEFHYFHHEFIEEWEGGDIGSLRYKYDKVS